MFSKIFVYNEVASHHSKFDSNWSFRHGRQAR